VRKKPINVECQASKLSIEALEWLENYTQDLAWTQNNWRIWESPAALDELCALGQATWRFNERRGIPNRPKMIRRSVDVVRFASKRDAMYFKLMFL
jgi:hypothetical protein